MVLLFKTLFTFSGSLRFLVLLLLLSSFDITTSIFSLTSSQSSKATIQEEAKALLAWKATLHNQNASLLHSWANSSSTACYWSGISCNRFGRVIDISLTSLGLSSTLHTFHFSSFPYLVAFNLTDNHLFDTILVHIGNLSRLNLLSLRGNQFSGRVPFDILGNLKSLKALVLDNNNLTGPIYITMMGRLYTKTSLKQKKKKKKSFDSKYCICERGSGNVYSAELSTRHVVAVKRLYHLHDGGGLVDHKSFHNQLRVLVDIRPRNIVKLYCFCLHARHSFLIYEYMKKRSLSKILTEVKATLLSCWTKRVNVVNGVAHAIHYMHHDCSLPIIHRDLSSNNVLLNGEYDSSVSDFDMARILNSDSSNWTTTAGIYGYLAPELAYTMRSTEKSDVYNFGVLSLEVIWEGI